LWSKEDKHENLDIKENGTEVFYSGRYCKLVKQNDIGPVVRADRPIPRKGKFQFEVCIESIGQSTEIAIGVTTKNTPLDKFPGWTPMSFGYHGDDGNIFCENEEEAFCPETFQKRLPY